MKNHIYSFVFNIAKSIQIKTKKKQIFRFLRKKFKTFNFNTGDLSFCLKDKDSILKAATY